MSISLQQDYEFLEHLTKKQLWSIIHEFQTTCQTKESFREPRPMKQEIPIEVFIRTVAPLEAVCKYLRENKKLTLRAIATLLKRDVRTVGGTYLRAMKKEKKKFLIKESILTIPIDVIKNRKLSVLENTVKYLREHHMLTLHQIAVLLHRDDRTMWTVYARSQRKGREWG